MLFWVMNLGFAASGQVAVDGKNITMLISRDRDDLLVSKLAGTTLVRKMDDNMLTGSSNNTVLIMKREK